VYHVYVCMHMYDVRVRVDAWGMTGRMVLIHVTYVYVYVYVYMCNLAINWMYWER